MSVRGLIAGGMSPPAIAAATGGTEDEGVGGGGGSDWAPSAVEDTTTVEDELAEADDETEDEPPDPARVGLGGGTEDDDGGSGAVGPSLSDTILVAFVAAELPMPPAPAPRPDASLLDALRMPKYDETLIPDEDEDRALIDEEGLRGLGTSLPLPHGLPLDSDRLLLFRLYCSTWDVEVRIILSDRRGISGAICWSAVDAKLTTDCEKL